MTRATERAHRTLAAVSQVIDGPQEQFEAMLPGAASHARPARRKGK